MSSSMELTIDVPPNPPTGFFDLPRELRDMIYIEALVEPSKWERRHQPTCEFCPEDDKPERPLFTWDKQSCNCIRRTGLNLLLANRRLHWEAAPIFWSKNQHCFGICKNAPYMALSEFVRDVGQNLRPECQVLLRHISVGAVRYAPSPSPLGGTSTFEQEEQVLFWETVLRCKGLRRLEVDSQCLRRYHGVFVNRGTKLLGLRKSMPQLQSFSWQDTVCVLAKGWPNVSYSNYYHRNDRIDYLHCLSTLRVPLDALDNLSTIQESVEDFQTTFLKHVRFAVETQLLGVPAESPDCRAQYRELKAGLNDTTRSVTLSLRDGTNTTINILGLPLSPETRKRHARQRYLNDVLLKKQGKPTSGEQRLGEAMAVCQAEEDGEAKDHLIGSESPVRESKDLASKQD